MATINTSRSMVTSHRGPTVKEMLALIAGIDINSHISIRYDKGYNQMDPGGITFSVSEKSH